ncbi:hypothetical protein LZ32DRAFT_604590 [Colletotrichum eremochloae]|nr:hypothetical protein LZ32DRAFT_604590 [Colletotrichum eremochloae]
MSTPKAPSSGILSSSKIRSTPKIRTSSKIPSSRKLSSNTISEKKHIFVYDHLRQPKVLYSIILDNPEPNPVMTNRFVYRQATLCDYPRQCPHSGPQGPKIEGVCVSGLTEAEIQKMDSFAAFSGHYRQEVVVRFICSHGNECARKAFVWVPSIPALDGIPSWSTAPSSGLNGGSNGAAHGSNLGATQGPTNSTFGGAAFAA